MAMRQEISNELQPSVLRRDLNLSRERMARLVAVSSKTIERWEEKESLPVNANPRSRVLFSQLQEMRDLGLTVYTPDGFQLFLRSPLPAFAGRTALQMIELGLIEDVISELAGDYEGQGF
ncbi:hypothetical protein BH09CHL1_BH09CHL1_11420 [soil metagenome]